MPVSMTALVDDLAAESADVRALVADLDAAGWQRPTPAEGWTIADQVSHLAYYDDVTVQSATDPDGFRAEVARLEAEGGVNPDKVAAQFRDLPGGALLRWFDLSRERLLDTFRALDPKQRLPWFGPPMSAASSVTARIMETWAHGQDIADALDVQREPTTRLRHVAHIGVGARAYSYAVNGRSLPDAEVRVELSAPDGSVWTWGPPEGVDRISGPALDFALLITQRRHRDDLGLTITGPLAEEWTRIGQAFAGPAGKGREPGRER
jgi:uncharacterized protein (TIGR03084 family)